MRGFAPFHKTLTFQLGIPFFALFIFLFIASGFLMYYSYTRDRQEAAEIPASIARQTRERVRLFFDNLRQTINLAAESADLGAVPLSSYERLFQNIVKANPSIIELAVFNRDGREIFRAEEAIAIITLATDVTQEPYFQEALVNKEYISDPRLSIYNTPYIVWTRPLIEHGNVSGVLRAIIDISTLWEIVSSVSENGLAHVYILDKDGATLVSSISLPDSDTASSRNILELLRNNPDTFIYTGLLGKRVGGRAEDLQTARWTVIAEIPLEVLMAETRQNLQILFIAMLFLIVFMLYQFVSLRQNLLNPISVFIKSVGRIAQGDYATRVHISVNNELALLATVMNKMSEHIGATTSEITQKMKMSLDNLERSTKLLIRRDLELGRANEQLRNLDRAKSEFTSLAAHQLRTPLSGIKWSLSVLLNNSMGELNPEQHLYLMKTYESNERMITLVNDLLQAVRLESGTMKFQFVSTQLGSLIENVLLELQPLAELKHVRLEYTPHDAPPVSIDAESIRVVLQNLIENALKYTPAGGFARVNVTHANNVVTLSVADNGMGIPKEEQSKVFERFFRASNAVRVETEGTGLGLYIAYAIVHKHNGSIRFTSEVNKGTTFSVTFPVQKKPSGL